MKIRKLFLALVVIIFIITGCNFSLFSNGNSTDDKKIKVEQGMVDTKTPTPKEQKNDEKVAENANSNSPLTPIPTPTQELENSANNTIASKENKIRELEAKNKKKQFMLCIAQDDLECFAWNGDSQMSDTWRLALRNNDYNGNSVMYELQLDIDTYLSLGTSKYELVWAYADLTFEKYKSGELKKQLGSDYDVLIDRLNKISKRLGIIYTSADLAESNLR